MKADHGATPIPIPSIVDDPRWIGRFSREVRKSIAALRDRKIIVRGRQGRGGYVPPWQVVPNGDDTVHVSPGEILSWPDGVAGPLTLSHFAEYTGGDVTVTANGVIYGTIPGALSLDTIVNDTWTDSNGDDVVIAYLRIFPDITESITVGFAATIPVSNTDFYWEIAKVELTDGVASVTKQVLTHNPQLWSFQRVP